MLVLKRQVGNELTVRCAETGREMKVIIEKVYDNVVTLLFDDKEKNFQIISPSIHKIEIGDKCRYVGRSVDSKGQPFFNEVGAVEEAESELVFVPRSNPSIEILLKNLDSVRKYFP